MGSKNGRVERLKERHTQTKAAIAALNQHPAHDARRRELKRERLQIKEKLVALGARTA